MPVTFSRRYPRPTHAVTASDHRSSAAPAISTGRAFSITLRRATLRVLPVSRRYARQAGCASCLGGVVGLPDALSPLGERESDGFSDGTRASLIVPVSSDHLSASPVTTFCLLKVVKSATFSASFHNTRYTLRIPLPLPGFTTSNPASVNLSTDRRTVRSPNTLHRFTNIGCVGNATPSSSAQSANARSTIRSDGPIDTASACRHTQELT